MAIKNTMRFLFILTSIFSINLHAQEDKSEVKKIIWSCKKPYTSENILWLVEWGSKSYIKVFDQRISTKYSMDGLEKRWDWGMNDSDSSYNYAITLEPDLTAQYYDFRGAEGGRAKAREIYQCSMSGN